KLNFANKPTKNVMYGFNLSGYRHVLKPQCFKNILGKIIVDFYTLLNPMVANSAKVVVNYYYQHTHQNPLHQSKKFAKQMAKTFGAFMSSNN
ncbi:4096_t:CDS:1, partial [Gigaspora margarita]